MKRVSLFSVFVFSIASQLAHASQLVHPRLDFASSSAHACSAKTISGSGSMEGRLPISPGDVVSCGFSLTMPGNHIAAQLDITDTLFLIQVNCPDGTETSLQCAIPHQSYSINSRDSNWYPASEQNDTQVWQGTIQAPHNLCKGKVGHAAQGATFSAGFWSTDTKDPVNVRFHYRNFSAGGWSGTFTTTPSCPWQPTPSQSASPTPSPSSSPSPSPSPSQAPSPSPSATSTATGTVGIASQLIFSQAPTTINAAVCTGYTVLSQDSNGNLSSVNSNVIINLSEQSSTGQSSGIFYTDSLCTSSTSSVTLAANSNSKTFYFRDLEAQSVSLAITNSGGLTNPSNLSITVQPGTPAQLALSGNSPINAAICTAYQVTAQDSEGNPAAVSSATAINLSGNGSGTFYSSSDPTCASAPVTSTTIAANSSNATFYFMDNTAESVTLVGTSSTGTSSLGSTSLAVVIQSASPAKLILSGSSSILAAVCTAYTVAAQDAEGNPSQVSSATTIHLSESSQSGAFYASSDSSCTSAPITSTTIAANSSSSTFYFKDNTAESVTLNASDSASILSSAPGLTVNITAGTAAKLSLSGPSPVNAGACTQYTVTSQDVDGNLANVSSATTILLSGISQAGISQAGNSAGTFYSSSDSTCSSTPIFSASIAAGTNKSSFYFMDTQAEVVSLNAADSAGVLSSAAALAVQVNALSAYQMTVSGSSSINAGSCTDYTVSIQDQYGNAVSPSSSSGLLINLANTGSGKIYSDSGCSSAISSIVVPATANAATYYFLDDTAESVSLSAVDGDSANLISTPSAMAFAVTVQPGTADTLALSGSTNNLIAGQCVALTLETTDTWTNASDVTSNVTVSLMDLLASGTPGAGSFYSDSSCDAQYLITIATIASGQDLTTVYFQDPTVQSLALSISEAAGNNPQFLSPTSNIFNVAITPGLPASILISANNNQSAEVGSVLGNALQAIVMDSDSNPVGAGIAVTWTSTSGGGSVASCSSSVTNSNGISSCTPTLGTTAGTNIFTASISGTLAGATNTSASFTAIGTAAVSPTPSMLISVGTSFMCTSNQGDVQCWGLGSSGQLGNDSTSSSDVPVQVQGLTSGILALGAGGTHACAATASGIWCWGLNFYGQLGNNSTTNSSIPVAVNGIDGGVQQIGGGTDHTCALVSGSVYCWGYNYYGQLGNGTTSNSSIPVLVEGLPGPAQSISVGNYSTCALVSGVAYCWGYNDYGQLGNGDTSNSSVPVLVQGLSGTISTIAMGFEHACSLISGAVQCWGNNEDGQLGNNTYAPSYTPQPVSGISGNATQLLAGGENFNCVITQAGAVQCWGQGNRYELGDNSNQNSPVAVQVSGLTSGYSSLSTGYSSACAYNGRVLQCWGFGTSGQLGDDTDTTSTVPVPVSGY